MKTKIFTITKTGFTSGIYGCTNELFTCNYTKISKYNGHLEMDFFHFKGTYWAEERVADALKAKGFREFHSNANYGKALAKEVYPSTMWESEAIEYINNSFKY